MLNKSDLLIFLKNNQDKFRTDFHITKIGLIGSFARDEQTENSDIDLLVEFEPGADDIFGKKTQLRQLLKTSFNRDVDICTEKYIKPYLKDYILKDAIYV